MLKFTCVAATLIMFVGQADAKGGFSGNHHAAAAQNNHTVGAPATGWGPNFKTKPGVVGLPGTLQLTFACPCTVERDPLVNRPLYGGMPNVIPNFPNLGTDGFSHLQVMVTAIPQMKAGTLDLNFRSDGKPTTGPFSPATQISLNMMLGTWGPSFDPKDVSVGHVTNMSTGQGAFLLHVEPSLVAPSCSQAAGGSGC